MSRKSTLFIFWMACLFILPGLLLAQQYSYTQYIDAGNPGGLNTDSDISTSGWTSIMPGSQSSNVWSDPVALPFPFEFFGTPVDYFMVSQNFVLTFDTTATMVPGPNTNLPSAELPDNSIACYWDEFTADPPTGSNDQIYTKEFGSAPNRQFWIKWHSFEIGNPNVTFQYTAIVLEETTNKIYLVDMYGSSSPLLTATVGLQQNATTAVQAGDSLIAQAGNGSSNSDNDYYEFFQPLGNDLAVISVLPPGTGPFIFPGDNVPIIAVIKNLGTNAQSGFNVSYSVDDGSGGTEFYSMTLNPNATDTVVFSTPWTPAAGGTYTVSAFTQLTGDENPLNDTSSIAVDITTVQSLNFEEDFENYTGNPSSIGWYGADNQDFGAFSPSSTSDGGWTSDGFGNVGTSGSARFNFWGTTTDDMDWLITPPIDMTTLETTKVLSFDLAVTPFSGTAQDSIPEGDTLFVVASTDGQNWERSNILAFYTTGDNIPPTGRTETIDLSAYATSTTLFIGFLAMDLAGPRDINVYVDNVFVGEPPQFDMAVSEFLNFPAIAQANSAVNFDVVVSNVGANPVLEDTLDIFLNGTLISSNMVAPLNPGESDTLSASVTASSSGIDTVTAALRLIVGDGNPANDTLSATYSILSTLPLPFTEMWDTTEFDPASWPEIEGTPEIIDSNGVATGTFPYPVPSEPYFLSMNNDNSIVASGFFDLSGQTDYVLAMWESEHDLEIGESVFLEYYDNSGQWKTLHEFAGTNNGFGVYEPFEQVIFPLPADAYHASFRFRWRTAGGLSSTDEWYFDDILLTPASTFPSDVAAELLTMPQLTMIPQTQPGILQSIGFEGILNNLGPTNTGDANILVTDTAQATIFQDALSNLTINAFSDTTVSFPNTWDASTTAAGMYDLTLFVSGFSDSDPSNDSVMSTLELGEQMGYDNGVHVFNITYSSTVRSLLGTRFTLTDDDTLTSVSMLITSSTTPTDSFSIDIYTSENDTPATAIARVFRGTFGDLGPLPVLAQFFIQGGLPISAGDFYAILDFDTPSAAAFPLGADNTALGAAYVNRRFVFRSETSDWLFFEDSSNPVFATLTPIIRTGFRESVEVHDYALLSVEAPDWVVVGSGETVTAVVRNLGNQPENNVPVRLFDNGTLVGEQLASLNPGETDTLNFSYVAADTGTRVLDVVSFLLNDAVPGNDSASASTVALPQGSTVSQTLITSGFVDKLISNTLPNTNDTLTYTAEQNAYILDMEVIIDSLTHTWDADIDMYFISPDGDTLELSTDNGGSGDNYIGTIFDDQAAISIVNGSAPFTGFFRPEGYPPGFSQFRNMDPAGDWVLSITDDFTGDDGMLHQWSILFTLVTPGQPGPPPLFEETFNDTLPPADWIVVDNDSSGAAWTFVQGLDFGGGNTVSPQAGQSFWWSSFINANSAGLIDEWLISPKIDAADFDSLFFYAGAVGGLWDDSLKVWVSTTDNQLSSFTNLLGYFKVDGPIGNWTRYGFDLSAFDGQDIYVAVNYYIVDGGPSGSNSDNVWVDHFIVTGSPIQPVTLNPPRDVTATGAVKSVILEWNEPLPPGTMELAYDDGGAEIGLGFGAGVDGDFAVRFTPTMYPAKLLAIRTYWANAGGGELNDVTYSIYEGNASGPGNLLAGPTPYTVTERGTFSEIDISGLNLQINSGDFYYSFFENTTGNFVLGFDQTSSARRSWINSTLLTGGQWMIIDDFNPTFAGNFMIRAIVQEGTTENSRVVLLDPVNPGNPTQADNNITRLKELFAFSGKPGLEVRRILDRRTANSAPAQTPSTIYGIEQTLLGFRIYRSEAGSPFALLDTTGAMVTSYLDTAVTVGTTYSYYLTALYDLGESPPSDTVSAIPSEVVEEIKEHVTPEFKTAVTNEGTVGMINEFGGLPGFQWPIGDANNWLFEAGFMFGVPPNQVVDAARVIDALGAQQELDADFQFTDAVNVLANNADSTVYQTSFDDSRANQAPLAGDGPNMPIGLAVSQWSYTYTDSSNSGYILFKLKISNTSGNALDSMLVGMYQDWDIKAYDQNTGMIAFDTLSIPGLNANLPFQFEYAYLYDQTDPTVYLGAVPLSQNFFRASRIADNAQEIFPDGASPFTEANKYNYMLERRANDPFGDPFGAQDKSIVFGLGGEAGNGNLTWPAAGFSLASGASVTTGMAIVGGNTLADFVQNARAAIKKWVALGNPIAILDTLYEVPTGISDNGNPIPREFALEQNYPNPFNPTTTIRYALKENVKVKIEIYNILGQRVRTLLDENQTAGYKKVEWDGLNDAGQKVSSGIYIYKMVAGDFVKSRKMILLK